MYRCINISSASGAHPYIWLKGRATDFVPLPEGWNTCFAHPVVNYAGQAPGNEEISTPTPWAWA
jgi:hypothetical protein